VNREITENLPPAPESDRSATPEDAKSFLTIFNKDVSMKPHNKVKPAVPNIEGPKRGAAPDYRYLIG
jgi:hypothetical protein